MATRKAKPDGQYHLKPEEVDDFIRGQLVTSLPGTASFRGHSAPDTKSFSYKSVFWIEQD